jgi:hypothetical protein
MALKPISLLCATVVLPGCFELQLRCGGGDDKENKPVAAELRPGDRVVGRWGDAFHPGTVLESRPGVATVLWDELQPTERTLPAAWLVRARTETGKAAAGHWLLCRRGAQWRLCRVIAGAEAHWRVRTLDGLARRVDRRDLLPLPAGLRGWAPRHGTHALEEAMAKQALEHLEPASAGKPVRVGQAVLGRWSSGGWYDARVVAVGNNKITLAWKDGSAQQATPPDDVAPLYPPDRLVSGALLFCRWNGSGWWKARVIEPLGQGQRADIRYSDGSAATARAADCIAGRAGPDA